MTSEEAFQNALRDVKANFDAAIRAKTVTKDNAQYQRSKAAFLAAMSNSIGFASI